MTGSAGQGNHGKEIVSADAERSFLCEPEWKFAQLSRTESPVDLCTDSQQDFASNFEGHWNQCLWKAS